MSDFKSSHQYPARHWNTSKQTDACVHPAKAGRVYSHGHSDRDYIRASPAGGYPSHSSKEGPHRMSSFQDTAQSSPASRKSNVRFPLMGLQNHETSADVAVESAASFSVSETPVASLKFNDSNIRRHRSVRCKAADAAHNPRSQSVMQRFRSDTAESPLPSPPHVRQLPQLKWSPVLEVLVTNSIAKVNTIEQAGRQAVTVIQKAMPLLTRMIQRAAASREQNGVWERIGHSRAVLEDLISASERLLLELEHLFCLQGGCQTKAGQIGRMHGRRIQSLLRELAGAKLKHEETLHASKLAGRFGLIREPHNSLSSTTRRLSYDTSGQMDFRNLHSVLRSVLGAHNTMIDMWRALTVLSSVGLSHSSASWPLIKSLDVAAAADVLRTLQAGEAAKLQLKPTSPEDHCQDSNDVPQSPPAMSRWWWKSPVSPLKRSSSSFRSAASTASCLSAKSGLDALDLTAIDLVNLDLSPTPSPARTKGTNRGGSYRGAIQEGQKHGLGQYLFKNGDRYEGRFQQDCLQSHGIYTFATGGIYQGQWANNVFDGLGVETFPSGGTFHGSYRGGFREGWGACSFSNGDYYEGQWVRGCREGRGMQQSPDLCSYVGDYRSDKREGFGCFTWGSGDRYIGEFSGDMPHGVGVFFFQSGQMYEGQWVNGSKQGWSIFTLHNGQQWAGHWKEGLPLWLQNAVSAPQQPSADSKAANVRRALDAAAAARQAGSQGAERFSHHWKPEGKLQELVKVTVHQAVAAAEVAASCQEAALHLATESEDAVSFI